tara:strand:- start:175 stop:330 length:156 start_codon:yes stop_codon:yes gene_type:complete
MKKINTKNILTKIFNKGRLANVKKKTAAKTTSKNIKKKTKVIKKNILKKKN